jgi:transcriptional regulator with XRE-family HTH domain
MTTAMTTDKETKEARENISANVARLMEARNLTQEALASEASISQSFVSKILRGILLPNGLLLHKIARALNTTSENLLQNPRRKAS